MHTAVNPWELLCCSDVGHGNVPSPRCSFLCNGRKGTAFFNSLCQSLLCLGCYFLQPTLPHFFLPVCQITWFGKQLIVHCMTLMFDISFLFQFKKKNLEKKVKFRKNREDSFVFLQFCFLSFFFHVLDCFSVVWLSPRGDF